MMMLGCEPMITFQMVDMVEVLIQTVIEENRESDLEAIQAVFTIKDLIHDDVSKTSSVPRYARPAVLTENAK